MKFEFAKYTEITDLAFQERPSYKEEKFIRFFICPDVHDTWYCRILEGYDANYQVKEGSYLLERNNIPNDFKGQKLDLERVKDIIHEDDGSNWDFEQSNNLQDLIDMIDDGLGIINLKESVI